MSDYFQAVVRRAERWTVPTVQALLDEGFLAAGVDADHADALAALAPSDATDARVSAAALVAAVAADPTLRDALRASVWCQGPGAEALDGDLAGALLAAREADAELADMYATDHALFAHAVLATTPLTLWRITIEAAEFQGPFPDDDDPAAMRVFCAQLAAEALEGGHPEDSRIARLLGGSELYDSYQRGGVIVVSSARCVGHRTVPIGDAGFRQRDRDDPLIIALDESAWEPGDELAARTYTFTMHASWADDVPVAAFRSLACTTAITGWRPFG